MKTTELARAAGVTAETVRHYVRVGLLDPARDPHNGYRVFGSEDLRRLRFARAARSLGFSVDDVLEILEQSGAGEAPCPMVRERARERLGELRSRIAELDAQRARMERVLELWEALPDGVPDGRSVCPLIERAAGLEPGAGRTN